MNALLLSSSDPMWLSGVVRNCISFCVAVYVRLVYL